MLEAYVFLDYSLIISYKSMKYISTMCDPIAFRMILYLVRVLRYIGQVKAFGRAYYHS